MSADADISAFPVNLIYFPEVGHPGVNLLARVKFTGADFSQRPGNYFAHSLIIDDVAADLSGLMPAELWEAPVWQSEPGESESLPVLGLLVARSASIRGQLHEELAGTEQFSRSIACLVATADAAVSGGRHVLVVGHTSSTVWQWIMASSYLLGPFIAPRMSFCTYAHDPARARPHVIGVVSSRELDTRLRMDFAVLDLRASSPEAASMEPVGQGGLACAAMLADVGIVVAEKVWAAAATIGRPDTETLASWHPILACAVMSIERELSDADLAVAVSWLGAHEVDSQSRRSIVAGSLSQRLGWLGVSDQSILVDNALLVEDESRESRDIAGRIEAHIVRQSLGRVARGGADVDIVHLKTNPGRTEAQAQCDRLLRDADVGTALALLRWASQAGIAPDESLLANAGQRMVAQAQVTGINPDDLRPATAEWRGLRAGMVDRLAGLPEAQMIRMCQLFGDLLEPADFAGVLTAGERWLGIRAGLRGTSPVKQFIEICELRDAAGQAGLSDEVLLRRLWPRGAWSSAEALVVVQAFSSEKILNTTAATMIARMFLAGPGPEDLQRSCWANVAFYLSGWPEEAQRLLGVSIAVAVNSLRQIVKGARSARAIRRLAERYEELPPLAQHYLAFEVPHLILRLEYPDICSAFVSCPPVLIESTCMTALELLLKRPEDAYLAARLYVCRNLLIGLKDKKAGFYIEKLVFEPMAKRWTRSEIATITRCAKEMQGKSELSFAAWIIKYRRRGRLRLFG
jgi:GTPase-associated protein 1, N-terminal domain type 2/GTPase-associated protein 1, middle domain